MQPHIPTTEVHWTNLRHFRIFRNTVDLFGTAQNDLTNQTTTFGIKHIRNSNRTPVLNIQWFGNSKTIMFYLKHKARPCSASTGSLKSFFYLLRCVPKSANKTSNCLTDILKTYKSGRDTASTWIKTMKFIFSFHSVFFEAKFPAKMQHIQCAHTVHGKFGCGKFVSSFTFSITRLVCGDIEDHKGQLWRRNNEVCMAKWNYIKVNKKQNKKFSHESIKFEKLHPQTENRGRTMNYVTERDFVPLAF